MGNVDYNLDLVTEKTVWEPNKRTEVIWDEEMNQVEWEKLLEDTQYVIK